MAGNGPIPTVPLWASDEMVAIRCTSDYPILAPPWQQLAAGTDGVFASNTPWVLTSSINFQAQGVMAQNVIWLKKPSNLYPGGGMFYAIDSASGTSVTLRQIGQPLNIGSPPGPSTGVTGVEFSINTFTPQIEEATYFLKERFMIDEAVAFRASFWLYQGVEDPYRVFRRAVVLRVLADRYLVENRAERGDFEMKLKAVNMEFKDVIGRITARWGTFGNSNEPSHIFGTKFSR